MRNVVLALALFGLTATPALASGPPVIIDEPVAGETFVNPCTGETITLTGGTFQIVFHTTLDTSGGIHVIVEGNAKGVEGVSDTGTPYRATGGFWSEFNLTGAFTTTLTGVLNLIGRGSGDNFAEEAAFHATFNAQGEVTSNFAHFANGTCRG